MQQTPQLDQATEGRIVGSGHHLRRLSLYYDYFAAGAPSLLTDIAGHAVPSPAAGSGGEGASGGGSSSAGGGGEAGGNGGSSSHNGADEVLSSGLPGGTLEFISGRLRLVSVRFATASRERSNRFDWSPHWECLVWPSWGALLRGCGLPHWALFKPDSAVPK